MGGQLTFDFDCRPVDVLPPVTKHTYVVHEGSRRLAVEMIERFHYAGGGANTSTYVHGMYLKGSPWICAGIAWWIPPTRQAAAASFGDPEGVLALSRLVVDPRVPKNGASFLLGRSMAQIDRGRWPCLVTYADEWRGHTGAIYRATNWEYCGKTRPEPVWVKDGRMVSRKAGPRTRTTKEMQDLGAICVGSFAKHKFRHIVRTKQ